MSNNPANQLVSGVTILNSMLIFYKKYRDNMQIPKLVIENVDYHWDEYNQHIENKLAFINMYNYNGNINRKCAMTEKVRIMTIRQAGIEDADCIVELIYLAIKDIALQLTGESDDKKAIAQIKQFYFMTGNRFSKELILVKEIENRVVGMILCYHGQDADELYRPIWHHLSENKQIVEPFIDKEADIDEYYIDALAVNPAEQGKGIGKELFRAAEQYARNHSISKIALNVDIDNKKALKLYNSLGYKADAQIEINKHLFWHMVKLL